MARPGVGVAGQFCGPLHHLLRRVTVLTCQWPPLRAPLWLWLHTHPFRRACLISTASPYCTGRARTGIWTRSGGAPEGRRPAGRSRRLASIRGSARAGAGGGHGARRAAACSCPAGDGCAPAGFAGPIGAFHLNRHQTAGRVLSSADAGTGRVADPQLAAAVLAPGPDAAVGHPGHAEPAARRDRDDIPQVHRLAIRAGDLTRPDWSIALCGVASIRSPSWSRGRLTPAAT